MSMQQLFSRSTQRETHRTSIRNRRWFFFTASPVINGGCTTAVCDGSYIATLSSQVRLGLYGVLKKGGKLFSEKIL